MKVAVCIVGFRNDDDIATCLRSLAESTHDAFEVVICENGGKASYDKLNERLPEALPGGQAIKVIDAGGNLGYAGGVNRCIQAAPAADAWWVLNPDTQPDPPALERLVALLSGGEFAAVGSTIYRGAEEVESRGGYWNRWLARAVALDNGARLGADASPAGRPVNYLSGASMLVGRQFVSGVGPMREDYFLYAEEVEWCLRGVQQGRKLGVASDATVKHMQGTTTGSVPDMTMRSRLSVFLDERNKILVTRDRYPACLPVAAPAALALLVLRFGKRAAWRQLGYALGGWLAGIRNERGPPAWIAGG